MKNCRLKVSVDVFLVEKGGACYTASIPKNEKLQRIGGRVLGRKRWCVLSASIPKNEKLQRIGGRVLGRKRWCVLYGNVSVDMFLVEKGGACYTASIPKNEKLQLESIGGRVIRQCELYVGVYGISVYT
ncbi:hypothetical protein TNCV_47991 [Trichonephila clavipes]|nr:hypothetical protein TNCV_47991 [Trichonephila clavipes]